MDRRAGTDSGFTLVETLVALVVVSLLSAALYQAFLLGNRAWTGLSARAAAIDEIAVAQRLLRQLLEQSYPLPAPTAQGFRVDFRGERSSITFWTPPPDIWRYPGGYIPARISMRETEGGKQLVLSLSELNGAQRTTEDVVLLRGLDTVTFEYFGPAGSAAPAWTPSWTDRAVQPGLVRLRVTFPDGDRRRWPDLVVNPKITLDAECVHDPLTQRCRGR
jgi:general secretion pathway protein J